MALVACSGSAPCTALQSSFVGAIAIADLVKTTLGPKGMDKILQSMGSGSVSVTNDGATILRSVYVDNPAAKVMIDISKVQDDEVGDGTTSVVVLAGELLRQAEKLVDQRIHPMTIIAGFRQACSVARDHLESKAFDNRADAVAFRNDLLNIARTTLSSKILTQVPLACVVLRQSLCFGTVACPAPLPFPLMS